MSSLALAPPAGTTGQTRAERMAQPLAADVLAAVADQYGVCVRPFTMEVGDPDTGAAVRAYAVWVHRGVGVRAVRTQGPGVADGAVPGGLAPHRGTRPRR
jgi:hypothetical protein